MIPYAISQPKPDPGEWAFMDKADRARFHGINSMTVPAHSPTQALQRRGTININERSLKRLGVSLTI